jgi:hypothetical protein
MGAAFAVLPFRLFLWGYIVPPEARNIFRYHVEQEPILIVACCPSDSDKGQACYVISLNLLPPPYRAHFGLKCAKLSSGAK